jgi:hypothetical protein
MCRDYGPLTFAALTEEAVKTATEEQLSEEPYLLAGGGSGGGSRGDCIEGSGAVFSMNKDSVGRSISAAVYFLGPRCRLLT